MLIKVLGGIDLFVGIIFVFGLEQNLTSEILLFFGLLMVGKSSLGMLNNFGSWIDIVAGAMLLLSILISFPWIILFIVGIFVLQKGIFSFF